MGIQRDIWKPYENEWRIHLDRKRKVNKIIKEASGHIACEYSKRGNVFAWDISVPDSHIKVAKKIYKEN